MSFMESSPPRQLGKEWMEIILKNSRDETWLKDVKDKETRELMSELGAVCCPKGCKAQIVHVTTILEVRNVFRHPEKPGSCYIAPDPVHKEIKTRENGSLFCLGCRHTWPMPAELTVIYNVEPSIARFTCPTCMCPRESTKRWYAGNAFGHCPICRQDVKLP